MSEFYTSKAAADFFERLEVYSAEAIRVLAPSLHKYLPCPNHYRSWVGEAPIGNVLHYTAGTSFHGTLRHFLTQRESSSNWVVARTLDPRLGELRRSLDLHRDLRAEVIQVVQPSHPAWHAGWVNRILTGIEVRNAGILRAYPKRRGTPAPVQGSISRSEFFKFGSLPPEELNFFWWPNGWTSKFTGEVVNVRGTWWETWSRGSMSTVVTLLRYLDALHPGTLRPEYLLAHHNVSPVKNDWVFGPDLNAIRKSVLEDYVHVDDIPWLAELDDLDEDFEVRPDPYTSDELLGRQADRGEEDMDDFKVNDRSGDGERGVDLLRRFGYDVRDPERVITSTRIYQRSRGLRVDGIAGPKTRAALERELVSWRLLSE